jgi:hypothetical protein
VIDLNYCPDWIFDVIAASVATEFLRSPLSLVSISQRFSEGMKGAYNEIDAELLSTSSENMILILNEAETGEASVDVLNAFSYFRINFEMDKTPRKLSGIFGSSTKGEKVQSYDEVKTRKRFKAFLFALRNGGMPSVPVDWKLEKNESIPNLAALVGGKTSVLDGL